jgi:hypothetical protein
MNQRNELDKLRDNTKELDMLRETEKRQGVKIERGFEDD